MDKGLKLNLLILKHKAREFFRFNKLISQIQRTREHSASVIQKRFKDWVGLRPVKSAISMEAKSRGSKSSDAYYLSRNGFGLADGVGEWKKFGVDPELFSKELMETCKTQIEASSEKDPLEKLQQALWNAHTNIQSYGSSTALLAYVDACFLSVVSIGDSELIVFKKTEKSYTKVFRTTPLVHAFNCPYQLAKIPPSLVPKQKKKMKDCAYDANCDIVPVRNGDVVIAGTDGLFDNVYESDIAALLTEVGPEPHLLAKRLLKLAKDKSLDKNYPSPFARAAIKAGKRYIGGKPDDILVLVAVIQHI